MVRFFFKLFVRNFLKNKLLNAFNVLGLALGIIATLLVVIYSDHAMSYDKFHDDPENIYRLEALLEGDIWFSNLGAEHGRAIKSGIFPEVKNTVLIKGHRKVFLSHGDKSFAEDKIYQAEVGSSFFEMFNFQTISGNPEYFLSEPYSAVITSSMASKYFDTQSPLGKTIQYDSMSLKVMGVISDVPTNSHLDFDLIYTNPGTFNRDHVHLNTYVHLVDGTDPVELENKIMQLDISYDESEQFKKSKLVPLPEIFFKSQATFGSGGQGDNLQLISFIIVGALILFITSFNYINLSLAIYTGKRVEMGVRKILGESPNQIVTAFVAESVFMSMITIPLVFIGVHVLIPVFNQFIGVHLENRLLSSPVYWMISLGFMMMLSVITTVYPTLAIAKTNLAELLKSKMNSFDGRRLSLKNALVFLQFILLFTLGVSAWFMKQQITFMDNKDMGFNPQGVIRISNGFMIDYENYQLFKSELLTDPRVLGVSCGPMTGDTMEPSTYAIGASDDIFENLLYYQVDQDYFDLLGMEIVDGNLEEIISQVKDGKEVIFINQNLAERIDQNQQELIKRIKLSPNTNNERALQVSAVFKDFNFFALKNEITPQVISMSNDLPFVNRNILIKANEQDMLLVSRLIEEKWQRFQPNMPIKYEYLGDVLRDFYADERRTGQLTITFSILAIMLSLMGLIGLTIHIINRKAKEMAIRKVLGANLIQIITLLNKELFMLILFAAVLGGVISYQLISIWLEDYVYTIDLSPLVSLVSIVIVYAVVFLITWTQSFRSTTLNPNHVLKNE